MGDLGIFDDKILNFSGTHGGKVLHHIDIKGGFTRFNDGNKFSIIQKALMHTNNIYVNKLVVPKFFKNAWLPKPILDKGDPIWTNGSKNKPRAPRAAFKDCVVFSESKWKKGN